MYHYNIIFISFSFGTQLLSELQTIVEIVIKYVVLTINSTRSWFFLSRRIHSRCETTKTLCDIDRWTDDYVRAQSEDALKMLNGYCQSLVSLIPNEEIEKCHFLPIAYMYASKSVSANHFAASLLV